MVEAEKQKAVMADVAIRTAAREPFSTKGLLERIVKFIVADDQVSIFLHSWSRLTRLILTGYQGFGMPRISRNSSFRLSGD